MSRLYLLTIAVLTVVFVSCASVPDRVSPEWSEAMFFKNAQEAMDESLYKTALYYYEVFLIRYPENHQMVIAAEYERAFIYYKTGDYKRAEAEYQAIIKKYDESPYAILYHPRFRRLCEIGLTNIEKQRAVQNRLFWRNREKEWAEEHGESLTEETDPIEI